MRFVINTKSTKLILLLFFINNLFAQNICFPEDWQLVKDSNPPHTIVVACYNIAGCFMERQNFDSVFYYLRKGEKVAQKAKDQEGLGMIFLRIAETNTILGNYTKSLVEIQKAIQIFEKLQFSRGELTAMVALCDVYKELGDYESIIKIYPSSVYLAKKIGSPNEIKMHAFMADVYISETKSNSDSLIYYSKLLKKAAVSFKTITSIIDADNYLANAYLLKKQYDKAEKLYKESFKVAQKEKSERALEMINLNLSNLYILKGNVKEAEFYFKAASQNLEKNLRNIHKKSFLLARSKIDSLNNDFKNAYFNFKKYYDFEKKENLKISQSKFISLQSNLDYSVTKKYNKVLYDDTLQKENQLLKQRVYLMLSLGALLFISLALWQYFRNKTKKRELIFAKLNLENELKLIKTQLNPHFVQNAFNTLSLNLPDDTIGNNNKNYIMQLSAYFRKVLEVTNNDVHSLEAELEFTEEYLKLQQKIVKNTFEYKIEIDDNFDTFSIEVPTMLLQPYVENCIKHGFEGLDYKGIIIIKCTIEGEMPIIEIIDNGQGSVNNNYSSNGYGTDISKKRLTIFSENKGNSIEIKNLENGKGCRVRICLGPVINYNQVS